MYLFKQTEVENHLKLLEEANNIILESPFTVSPASHKQQEKEMSIGKIHQISLSSLTMVLILEVLSKAEHAKIEGAYKARGIFSNLVAHKLEEDQESSSLLDIPPAHREHDCSTYEPNQVDKWDKFFDSVKKMNETYELPVANSPSLLANQAIRTQQFLDIMRKELSEGDEMLFTLQGQFAFSEEGRLEALTQLADWYGDMIVYITSEAIRNGIPIMEVLEIIMASNMTKLGEDGKPIKDENDKFQKGPNFIPPEQKIKELLKQRM